MTEDDGELSSGDTPDPLASKVIFLAPQIIVVIRRDAPGPACRFEQILWHHSSSSRVRRESILCASWRTAPRPQFRLTAAHAGVAASQLVLECSRNCFLLARVAPSQLPLMYLCTVGLGLAVSLLQPRARPDESMGRSPFVLARLLFLGAQGLSVSGEVATSLLPGFSETLRAGRSTPSAAIATEWLDGLEALASR